MPGVAGLVDVAVGGGQADAEAVGIRFGELRDVRRDRAVADAGVTGVERVEDRLIRGPSGVETSPSSSGTVIDWLKGMPRVSVWNQPTRIRRPSPAGMSLNDCAA